MYGLNQIVKWTTVVRSLTCRTSFTKSQLKNLHDPRSVFSTTHTVCSWRCYAVSPTTRLGIVTPQFLQAHSFLDRIAVVDHFGGHRYRDIIVRANILADKILDIVGAKEHIDDERICVLCCNDVSYVVALWASWISGGVAVPLSNKYPAPQLRYFIEDSQPKLILSYQDCPEAVRITAKDTNVPLLELSETDYTRNELKVTAIGRYSLKNAPDSKLKPGQVPKPPQDSDVNLAQRLSRYAARWNRLNQLREANKFSRRPALFIYTSGTTGRPKGVVHTYSSLHAQIAGMSAAWRWSPSDVMLHCLPLHHVHGVVNALLTPLQHGACCVMLEKFDADDVWKRLVHPLDYHIHDSVESADVSSVTQEKSLNAAGPQVKLNPPTQDIPVSASGTHSTTLNPVTQDTQQSTLPRHVNMFTAVPTIYAKLIEAHDRRDESAMTKEYVRASCTKRIRLFMCGSASLPLPILERWEAITGHRLLERYGMTELGMALTNPLEGVRQPGAVGRPFPHVEVRVVRQRISRSNDECEVIVQGDCQSNEGLENEDGELQVRGATLFKEYWRKEEATRESFTRDGWFITGDTAVYRDGAYRIVGRTSVDIIKSGGYKIGALEVEQQLLAHPDIAEVVVVGVADLTWGQVVAAVLVLKPGRTITAGDLKEWAAERLPPYQVPSIIRIADSITRNAMGKVNKKQILAEMFSANKGSTKSST